MYFCIDNYFYLALKSWHGRLVDHDMVSIVVITKTFPQTLRELMPDLQER